MFSKNTMRPAFAAASADGQASSRKTKNDAFMYDVGASETDDFGSFGSSSGGSSKKDSGKQGGKIKPAVIAIAVAAVVAVVLLIVLVVALIGGRSGDIEFKNNTFVAFCDEDGIWRVAANGKVVGEYENEIELVPAADRSFAYIIEESEDGYSVTVTDGKTVTEITTSPVTKVLATASLAPGVVWLDSDNGIYLYTETNGEERITRDVDATLANSEMHYFRISGDAQTVIYTKFDEDNPSDMDLCVFRNSSEMRFASKVYPEAISDDGSMIFASKYQNAVTKSLYVLPYSDEGNSNGKYLLADNFGSIIDVNTEGNEVVFTSLGESDSAISTFIVAFDIKKMDEVATPQRIAKGNIYVPTSVNNEIARFSTFSDAYFKATITDLQGRAPVYYVDKDFIPDQVSKFAGQFTPDGDYFYYTNDNGTLQRIDLSDRDAAPKKIAEDIEKFAVTGKGNVYWVDDTTRLMYYNASKEKKIRIAEDVENISLHTYSNTLYYTGIDALNIYSTEEGSKGEPAKFESGTVNGIPQFTTPEFKKTFAMFYDSDNSEWRMFYTSNGKSFKFVGVCSDVYGFEAPVDFEDILDDLIPSGTDTDTDTDTKSAEE